MKYYEPSKNGSDEPDECKFTEGSKPGVRPKLDVIEQLFMFLVWLSCGFGQKHLAWLFGLGKRHVTYKALVGISPSGAITFVSQLYPGSLSDKEIVSRCGILHPELWEKGDSIMACKLSFFQFLYFGFQLTPIFFNVTFLFNQK